MEAPPVVVLDVAAQHVPQRRVAIEGGAVQQLGLERVEEGFHVRVVARAVERGTLLDAQLTEAIPKDRARILASAIAVEDETSGDSTSTRRSIEHGPSELGAAAARERPGKDASRILIHDDGEEAPPASDRDVRDVANPDAIGPSHRQPSYAIGVLAEEAVQLGVRTIDPRDARSQPRVLHEPHHASPARRDPFGAERADEPRAPVGAAVGAEQPFNAAKENPVLFLVGARSPTAPRVVASAGDPVQRTESGQRVRVAVPVDERERFTLGSEQNRIAFFRRACSV